MKKVTKGHVSLRWYVLLPIGDRARGTCTSMLRSFVKHGAAVSSEQASRPDADIIRSWDLGGQPRFRSMWERYCRGANAIV